MTTKNQRQHRITKLLEAQVVTSQGQLVALLADQGVEATQTTVSRDLEDLGAVKVRLPGGDTAYALPELPVHQIAPEDHLRRVLGEWVVEVAYSGNLVVLRTPPGSAHVVGSALDRSGVDASSARWPATTRSSSWSTRTWGGRRWRPGWATWPGSDREDNVKHDRQASQASREGTEQWLSVWCWPTAVGWIRRWPSAG